MKKFLLAALAVLLLTLCGCSLFGPSQTEDPAPTPQSAAEWTERY